MQCKHINRTRGKTYRLRTVAKSEDFHTSSAGSQSTKKITRIWQLAPVGILSDENGR